MSAPVRLAMLGMISGNGHPFSWSAIINGYDPAVMARVCPYPVISEYLNAQPFAEVGIPDARVTHVWTDDPTDAPKIAAAAFIPHVVSRPEDVIGEVDAVIISTDDGTDHVRRARPFVEAGLPVFVDKPLATTSDELACFMQWQRDGARILSSSGMRYAPELSEIEERDWLWISGVVCKTWERYGIHALEPVYKVLGPGFTEVRSESQPGSDIVYCRHLSGTQITIAAIHDAIGSQGVLHAYGKSGEKAIALRSTYQTFRSQLLEIVRWVQSGIEPYPFSQTVELMNVLMAGLESRRRGGEIVPISSVINIVR